MGKYLDMIRQGEEAHRGDRRQSSTPESHELPAPGAQVNWEGSNGTTRGPGTVWLLHTDSDGTTWVFVDWAGEWVALNVKYLKVP